MNVVTGSKNLFQSWSVVGILRFTQVSTSFRERNRGYYGNDYWHQSNKEKCYDFYGHPTSIFGHNIIGLIAVGYVEDIVAFVFAKISSWAKMVKYFV